MGEIGPYAGSQAAVGAPSTFQEFIAGKVLLAPMAGVTDKAMRTLCAEQGADLAYTEMVSAKGLSYANEKTRHLLDLAAGERQVAVQLFGHEPAVMASQAAWVEEQLGERLAYIDINMGCPARKIVTKGDGSALMKTPELAASIVAAVSGAVDHPVTTKFRRGYELENETAVDFALRMEEAGAAAVAVHGRFAEQLYRGQADWDVVAKVKWALSIPVIGNGDVRCGKDARALVEHTGCDAVMIARAAEGNPWIFAEAKAALEGRPEPTAPTVRDRLEMARRHARLLAQEDQGRPLARMRRHGMCYVAGLPGAAAARARITACSTLEEFERLFDDLGDITSKY